MWKWCAIIVAGAAIGYAGVYFALSGTPSSPAAPEPPVPQTAPQSGEPVVLSHVVDVTDTDPLLDPLPGQPAGVPFDSPPALEPSSNVLSTTPPAAIPPAND